MNIFISGIKEGCGKTLIGGTLAAIIQSLGYKTCVYKPIQTGAIEKGSMLLSLDLEFVKQLDPYILTHATYLLTSNATAFASSNIENVKISMSDIENDYNILSKNAEFIFVESSGGLHSPIHSDCFNYNIPLALNLPVVFVVNPSNDSLNYILDEIDIAVKCGLNIKGIIVNRNPINATDIETISFVSVLKHCTNVEILGVIREFSNYPVPADELFSEILSEVDIQKIIEMKIPKLNPEY